MRNPGQPPVRFPHRKPVIAMIHVGALPGTASHGSSVAEIERLALREADIYRKAGVHGLLIENMHDTPYLKGSVGPEIVATLAVISREIRKASRLPCGIQILAGANQEALAVALAARLDFIRAEAYSFAHVADEGLMESCAGELLRYRRTIGAGAVSVWADIKKKHSSHAITADIDIGEVAHAVEFMKGDAVIVTGATTGDSPQLADLRKTKAATSLPVYLGSGMTHKNLGSYLQLADGFIVGSEFKKDGKWFNPLDPERITRFMSQHRKLAG
ncbi:BtpA family membrane complex biogenesis protein [bacterium]|nr:BtpA family membrane complex biogenesis protein [bacterium]